VMLSEETAVGRFPIEAVGTLHRIALETEAAMVQDWFPRAADPVRPFDLQSAIAQATLDASRHPEASVIITPSARGLTPMMISRLRPDRPILMLTESEEVARKFALIWGVIPVCTPVPANLKELLDLAGEEAGRRGLLAPGGLAIITAGYPIFGNPTNLVYLHRRES
jgi:pyruvate kinase